jgi:hypothetical protein
MPETLSSTPQPGTLSGLPGYREAEPDAGLNEV